jgi:MFS family permease
MAETAESRVTFRDVLKRTDFLHLWLAQAVSLIGDRLTQVALFIYILQLAEGSATAVGLFLASQSVPVIIFGPLAGVLVDRWDKRTTLVVCDLVRAAVIATVPLLGDERLVYAIGFLMAAVTTLFHPALQATVPELLGRRQEILVANSLLYSTKFFTDILGFTLAGTIVLVTGVKVAFLIDSATFVLSGLLILRIGRRFATVARKLDLAGVWEDLRAGIRHHAENPVVLSLLISFTLGVLAMGGLNALLLVAVDRLLAVERFWYGYLLSVQGVTMFATAVAIGKWGQGVPKPYLILPGFLATGLCAVALSLTRSLELAFFIYAVIGVANSAFLIPSITWVQEVVPFEMRGRVMALRTTTLHLAAACSSVVAGRMADTVGVTPVMAGIGVFLALTAVGSAALPGFRLGLGSRARVGLSG